MKYVSLTKHSEEKLRKDYVREHAKFIHSSYLLEDDLDKVVELHGRKYRIAGLWDTIGYKKIILLAVVDGTGFAHTDSQEVANALGFTKFRNFVTGKEITYDLSTVYRYNQMMNKLAIEIPVAVTTTTEGIDSDTEITDSTPLKEDDGLPTHERDNEYTSDDDDDQLPSKEEEVDPLVKALRGSDDDDGWFDDSDQK